MITIIIIKNIKIILSLDNYPLNLCAHRISFKNILLTDIKYSHINVILLSHIVVTGTTTSQYFSYYKK